MARSDLARGLMAALSLAILAVAAGSIAGSVDLARSQNLAVEANRAYEEGDYAVAVQSYGDALEAGLDHAVIHYNLGNAWFKQGELGEAIVSYMRALRRNPRDGAARANLERAQALIRDEAFAPLSLPVFLRPIAWVFSSLSLDEWTSVSLLGLTLLCLLGAARPWLSLPLLRRRAPLYLLAALTAVCIVMSVVRYDFEIRRSSAVVITGEVDVRSGPGNSYNLAFKVHEGLSVYVDEARGEWTRIHLGGELVGWVPSDQIEEI